MSTKEIDILTNAASSPNARTHFLLNLLYYFRIRICKTKRYKFKGSETKDHAIPFFYE